MCTLENQNAPRRAVVDTAMHDVRLVVVNFISYLTKPRWRGLARLDIANRTLLCSSPCVWRMEERVPFAGDSTASIVMKPPHPPRIRSSTSDQYDLLLGLVLVIACQSIAFGLDSLLSSLTGGLGLRTFRIHLLLQDSLTLFLGLGLVDL